MTRNLRPLSLLLVALLTLLVGLAAPAAANSPSLALGESIAAVAATAKPSVVGILTTMKAVRGNEKGRAAGTGFAYKDGVIITNAHVVEDAAEVKILFADKTVETVLPERISADAISDVAVIRVVKQGLKPLAFADSDKVAVGQSVVAVGNPLGFRLGNSVTAGILSGTGRALGSGYPFLQMDAPINPGNSGGPLFNLKGEVLGINSAKMADIGVEGLSFAIPANTAREIAEILLRDGKVERATLGISLDEGWQAYFGVPDTEGVTIANVISDGPAGQTALRRGDKLTKLNDTPISTTDDVFAFLQTKKPGDRVTVTVKRRGQVLEVPVTLASQEALRKVAEEEGTEVSGILIDLTAGQIQEAAEYGRSLARGFGNVDSDYFAVSGSNYAILWTEYLYVARRISSAYEFGFTPGVGFQQAVAKEINRKVEVEMEINGDRFNFLERARFTLKQGGETRSGTMVQLPTYTTSPDGRIAIANLAVRFETANLNPAEEVTVMVDWPGGKTVTFNFTLENLR